MSPEDGNHERTEARFPRVSGDEPADAEALKQFITFSPRERG